MSFVYSIPTRAVVAGRQIYGGTSLYVRDNVRRVGSDVCGHGEAWIDRGRWKEGCPEEGGAKTVGIRVGPLLYPT